MGKQKAAAGQNGQIRIERRQFCTSCTGYKKRNNRDAIVAFPEFPVKIS